MRKPVAVAMMIGLGLSLGGRANAQGLLGKANSFLGRISASMSGASNNAAVRTSQVAINQQTLEQQNGQARALTMPVQAQIAADRLEAKPLIERIVTTSACAINANAWNALNRQLEHPATFYSEYTAMVPMGNMGFHPKNKCLDIIRVVSWGKPAKNALSFKVELVSAQSNEATHQTFVLVKSDEEGWLVRSIGNVGEG